MFRSATMDYYSIFFNKENSLEVIGELGQLGIIEFEDLQPDQLEAQRNYFKQIQELNESLEILEGLKQIANDQNLDDFDYTPTHQQIQYILSELRRIFQQKNSDQFYHEIQEELIKKFQTVENAANDKDIIKNKLIENSNYLNILQKLREFLPKNFNLLKNQKNDSNEFDQFQIFQQVGIISQDKLFNFQRAIFRVTRGNIYQKYFSINQHYYDTQKIKQQQKVIVYISCQGGDNNSYLVEKISKLFDSYEIQTFKMPESQIQIETEISQAHQNQLEMSTVFNKSQDNLDRHLDLIFLNNRQNISYYLQTKIELLRQLQIYQNLNKTIITQNFVEGRIWVPSLQNNYLQEALSVLEKKKEFVNFRLTKLDHQLQNQTPPTLICTNEFTQPFQDIVNTYSIPKYKEINPGLFTIVTFPFLFGVMFGDIGHGLALFIFGLFLYLKKDSFSQTLISIRSLIIFMGFFATFCGFIYNDFLALPFPLSDSCYIKYENDIQRKADCVYPIGLDPIWHHDIAFINSMKMKMSIIIGVTHMLLGIILKGLNNLKFQMYVDFFFDFLPQLIFMLCTFGYMCFCIIIKWLQDFSNNSSEAPSIISLFIDFITKVNFQLFENQLQTQQILALISLICVPTMLLGKPIVFLMNQMKQKKKGYNKINNSISDDFENQNLNINDDKDNTNLTLNQSSIDNKQHEEHSFGEVFIHQAIETIEFVLGSISNTASYLRLWALSLAHSQLAKVFLDMIFKPWIQGKGNPIIDGLIAALMFVMFILVTFGVIMVMDLMECFLHALRLHWVEFQNKFYKGEGRKFEPINFFEFSLQKFDNQQKFQLMKIYNVFKSRICISSTCSYIEKSSNRKNIRIHLRYTLINYI